MKIPVSLSLLLCIALSGCGGSPLPAIQVAAWGDSLTAGVGGAGVSYPTVLGQLIHATVFDGGEGGDTSTVIAARMLADPPALATSRSSGQAEITTSIKHRFSPMSPRWWPRSPLPNAS